MNQIKVEQLKPAYKTLSYENLRDMLNGSAKMYADIPAFIIKHKNKGEVTYENITYSMFRDDVNGFGTAMLDRGWQGKNIAIMGNNSYPWMVTYFAALGGLGKCVPLDKGLPYEELESSLIRSYADILVFDKAHEKLVQQLRAEGKTSVEHFVCMDDLDGCFSMKDMIAAGKEKINAGDDAYMNLPIDNMEASIILFTSGTTSMAKAVMLSHCNIVSNLESILAVEDVHVGDVSMAFLPYHHTFGSMGQLVMLSRGVTTAFCDGLKYLQKNIVEYKVSVFFCVPLLIEGIYKKIMQTVKKQGKEKTVNFGIKLTKFLLKFGIDIRRKVFKEVLDQLGGNIRFVISGAAAIDPEALEGFKTFGIDTVQGYGMTESSPVLAAENTFEYKTGSIGKALPGVEIRIDEPNEEGIGELIARGPNVMLGYFENEEATAETLKDGWLHTGDLAYLDDGYIFICGRKKNVIVLKNGKNVYPEEIEVLISNLPYVEENFVFGKAKKGRDDKDLALWVKIVYKPEYMKETYNAVTEEEIRKVITADIEKINESMPTYKHIAHIVITDEPMVKTTTGKVKRFEETANL